MMISFQELPDSARLWIFPADRPLSPEEADRVTRRVENGLRDWAAHGSPVFWAQRLERDQFLMIGVDETRTGLTGCSIDQAVREIKSLETEMKLSFLDNARVFYREGDTVRKATRGEFRRLAEEGEVTSETPVFNNIITTVGELRGKLWEVPLQASWHARAFPVRSS